MADILETAWHTTCDYANRMLDVFLPPKLPGQPRTATVVEVSKPRVASYYRFGGVTDPSSCSMLIRLAGISGAAALALGAYGNHAMRERTDITAKQKLAFDTANRLHLIHSAVLLAAPNFRNPKLTGTLMLVGSIVFSGTCYHYALTGDEMLRKFTPMGGMILIVAWLSLIF